jgi:hypothetical protein
MPESQELPPANCNCCIDMECYKCGRILPCIVADFQEEPYKYDAACFPSCSSAKLARLTIKHEYLP